MKTELIQVACAMLGSLGYALIFHLKKEKLALAAVGGGLTWFLGLLLNAGLQSLFMAYLIAAGFATFYAEILARCLKAPVTIFVIPSIMPLVPGGSLYDTMEYLIQRDHAMMKSKALETGMLALALAMGITIVTMLLDIFSLITRRMGKNKNEAENAKKS